MIEKYIKSLDAKYSECLDNFVLSKFRNNQWLNTYVSSIQRRE